MLDAALKRARQEGHATRQGIIHGQLAAIGLARGSLQDAQVEAETGLLLVEESHFVMLQLLAAALVAHVERGELDAAAELADRGEVLGVAENHTYVADFLIARGRLRIAQGRPEDGVADLVWCGQRLETFGVWWPSSWRAYAAPALASLFAEVLARYSVYYQPGADGRAPALRRRVPSGPAPKVREEV